MRAVLALLRKDLVNFFNEPIAVALTFAVPLALIYIFGQVFGTGGDPVRSSGIPLAIVNESESPFARQIVEALRTDKNFQVVTEAADADGRLYPLSGDTARTMLTSDRVRFALILREDPTGAGGSACLRLRFLQNPRNEIETAMVSGLVQKHVLMHVPVPGAGGAPLQEMLGRLVQIENEQVVGGSVKSPRATRNVGGWAMMFLLFSLSTAAASLFEEKKAGLFLRLLAAPVRRTHILWSKYLCGTLIGLAQLLVLFTAGSFMYDIEVLAHLPALVLVATAAAAACTAFGMLLAAFAPSQAAASGMATFLILTMSAVGGAWFPISLMPDFLQSIAKLTIVHWAMDGFLRVLWQGEGILEVLPVIGVLAGISTAINFVSAWRFSRGSMFR